MSMAAIPPARERTPRLSIGLPVFNGSSFLRQSLDALLGQSFTDFELILSDNASTDETPDICAEYAERDGRVRYVRQEKNIGAIPNHNYVVHEARGELFKWASYDDLYHRELLRRCVQLLDADPTVILAHSYDAIIDEDSRVVESPPYPLATSSPFPTRRFHSMLHDAGGNDVYGVIRLDVLRRTHLHGSYHSADRVIVAELALHGRFAQWPEVLYYRRDHRQRGERINRSARARAAWSDPRRAEHSNVRLYAEYINGLRQAIETAPLSPQQKAGCYAELAGYLTYRAFPFYRLKYVNGPDPAMRSKAAESRVARAWARATGTPLPSVTEAPFVSHSDRPLADLGG
jgi:glycosyltransferase involved in cell wall biosynthesis